MRYYRQKIGCVLLSAIIAFSGSSATAGWFSKKPQPQATADERVGIWRVPAPILKKGKNPYSVMVDKGQLRTAIPDSQGRFLFSEKGAGVQCLAIIGTFTQILQQITYLEKRGYKIVNVIDELGNKIYIGVSRYKPEKRFEYVDGLTDATNKVVKEVLNFIPASDLADAADSIWTLGDQLYQMINEKGPKDTKGGKDYAYVPLYLKICYLKEDGMEYIATKELSFENLGKAIQRRFIQAIPRH